VNGDIAPKSIVVESADLISQWGRQYSRARHGERPGGFRGSYRRHATEGFHGNKGDPSGSDEPLYLNRATLAIANDAHGGAIWIIREGFIPDSSVHIGYQIQPDDRPLPEEYPHFSFLQSIGHLAAVDGAVVVDRNLRVLGFGAFIEISQVPKLVNTITDENKEEQVVSTKLGGGRHRSAVEFCARFPPAAAIVVSEDGRVSILWSMNAEALFCAPLSTVGVFSHGFYSENVNS
jgi:hypothetical protein